MVTRAELIGEAREWLGTRWRHQAHTKGLATDCGGMIYGVGFRLGVFPAVSALPEARRFEGYGRMASRGSLVEACRLLLVEIDPADMQPADVALMRFETEPQHLGILSAHPLGGMSLIHAYARMRKVVEHRLDAKWRAQVTHAFAYPGVTA